MAMTPKENFLAVLNHQQGDWIPCCMTDSIMAGFTIPFEKGPAGGGYDGFGVRWVTPASGSGNPTPEPGEYILTAETIHDWKKIVKFPNVQAFDWEGYSKLELSAGNPAIQAVSFDCGNGPFERLAALMGFGDALVAMVEEPEATSELLNAIVDYKIQVMDKVAKYYKADVFTNFDDIATQRGLFMSPSLYRELIKPCHKKMYDAAKSYGMIPVQHTCGNAESVVEDFIDTGVNAWTSVQPCNDIEGILKKHGDKLAIIGGYDTNGIPGFETASEEVIREEVRRCMDTYGIYKGYIFMGFIMVNSNDPSELFKAMKPLADEYLSYVKKPGM